MENDLSGLCCVKPPMVKYAVAGNCLSDFEFGIGGFTPQVIVNIRFVENNLTQWPMTKT